MKFSIKTLGFSNEDNLGVRKRKYPRTPYAHFEIHRVNSSGKAIGKARDSPTSSILKTPTAIFVTSRNSSNRTKRLKFANGPMYSENIRNGSVESNESNADSVEVAISPNETMQVSPEAWNAFLEYKKFNDYSNETEKTDYTYSKWSKFRHKEIIPGFTIRPNLSRPPLPSFRSSMSSSQSSSPSFTESFNYDDYESSVYKKENATEVSYDFKTPKLSNSTNRSKYYLRSSNFGVEDSNKIEETRSTQNSKNVFSRSPKNSSYFSSETISSSFPNSYSESILTSVSPSFSYSPEKMSINYLNSGSEMQERSSPYYAKIRSLNLDDADIDEVDVYDQKNYVYDQKNYSSSQKEPRVSYQAQLKPQLNRSLSQGAGNLFTYMFLYVTTIGTFTKDLFSKYILRRKNDHDYTPYGGKWEKYRGNTLSKESWLQGFGNKSKYYSPSYYFGQYYGQPRSWYRISDIGRIGNTFNMRWGGSPTYGVEPTSRKRKFWWLLIPLLLLGGIWLYKAEEENSFATNLYKQLDCKTDGLLTSAENTVKSTIRLGYNAFKRAAVSPSCYINDSWERIKLPFSHLNEWLWEKFSMLSSTSIGWIVPVWITFLDGLKNLFALSWDVLSNSLFLLFNIFADVINAIGNLLHHLLFHFTDSSLFIANTLKSLFGNAWKFFGEIFTGLKSYLYLLFFAPRETVKISPAPEIVKEACPMQQQSFANEIENLKSFSLDLSAIKMKIDELERKLSAEKSLRLSQDQTHDKQLEENVKTLQKYQVLVNNALQTAKRQANVRSSSILHYIQDINSKSEPPVLQEPQPIDGDWSVAYVKKLIADAIKLYDADKTGRVDYALETAGGQIQSIRCTETYVASPKSYVLLGWSVYTKTSSPRDAISPGMAVGQCWAFVGSQGFLVIQLSHTIKVTGFTMEHISKSLVPRGHIESAPKAFSMWGLKSEHDPEPHLFGEYTYLDNDETLQYFPVTYPSSERHNMVELKISSNHGNPNYTCLYRIRVHGDLLPIKL